MPYSIKPRSCVPSGRGKLGSIVNLNNMAGFYRKLNRFEDAEKSYNEAVKLYRSLSKKNPQACLPGWAKTLNALGSLYSFTKREQDAEAANEQECEVCTRLAGDKSAA